MIKELLLSSIISLSVSVRTPNDDTKPLDYEYSIKTEKNEGKFTYYEKVDYERELGINYLDFTGNYNYKFDNNLFLGLDDFFANLGGGGGYAWIIGASLGAVVHLAISKRS